LLSGPPCQKDFSHIGCFGNKNDKRHRKIPERMTGDYPAQPSQTDDLSSSSIATASARRVSTARWLM
jgi:hypothetical protein